MKRFVWTAVVALFIGGFAYAQEEPAKVEATVVYSYMRFVPQNNNVIQSFSLNGGGGSMAYFFNSLFAIKGELNGYASQTRNFTIPSTYCAGSCTGNVQGNLFTYNVGPELKFRTSHFEPFVDAMFGGAHSNVFGNLKTDCTGCSYAKNPNNNAFDFIIGGGIDVPLSPKISIRPAEFDYVLTRFGNGLTSGNNNQSNFRFQAGLQFRF
jgi:hypothetical protein